MTLYIGDTKVAVTETIKDNSLARKIIDRTVTELTADDLKGVTRIGYGAFMNCQGLTSITIPSSVTSIGSNAFYNCSALTSITIPSSVTSIGGSAFQYCTKLTSMTIPSSVTSIGNYAFYNCSVMTTITMLPTTPPTLGNTAAIPTAHFPTDGSGDGKIIVPKGSLETYQTANNWATFKSYMQEESE